MNDLRGLLLLIFFGIPLIATTNLECRTNFICADETHFYICLDFGDGKLIAMDTVVFPCPPRMVCDETNINECHIPIIPTTTQINTLATISEKISTIPPEITTYITTAYEKNSAIYAESTTESSLSTLTTVSIDKPPQISTTTQYNDRKSNDVVYTIDTSPTTELPHGNKNNSNDILNERADTTQTIMLTITHQYDSTNFVDDVVNTGTSTIEDSESHISATQQSDYVSATGSSAIEENEHTYKFNEIAFLNVTTSVPIKKSAFLSPYVLNFTKLHDSMDKINAKTEEDDLGISNKIAFTSEVTASMSTKSNNSNKTIGESMITYQNSKRNTTNEPNVKSNTLTESNVFITTHTIESMKSDNIKNEASIEEIEQKHKVEAITISTSDFLPDIMLNSTQHDIINKTEIRKTIKNKRIDKSNNTDVPYVTDPYTETTFSMTTYVFDSVYTGESINKTYVGINKRNKQSDKNTIVVSSIIAATESIPVHLLDSAQQNSNLSSNIDTNKNIKSTRSDISNFTVLPYIAIDSSTETIQNHAPVNKTNVVNAVDKQIFSSTGATELISVHLNGAQQDHNSDVIMNANDTIKNKQMDERNANKVVYDKTTDLPKDTNELLTSPSFTFLKLDNLENKMNISTTAESRQFNTLAVSSISHNVPDFTFNYSKTYASANTMETSTTTSIPNDTSFKTTYSFFSTKNPENMIDKIITDKDKPTFHTLLNLNIPTTITTISQFDDAIDRHEENKYIATTAFAQSFNDTSTEKIYLAAYRPEIKPIFYPIHINDTSTIEQNISEDSRMISKTTTNVLIQNDSAHASNPAVGELITRTTAIRNSTTKFLDIIDKTTLSNYVNNTRLKGKENFTLANTFTTTERNELAVANFSEITKLSNPDMTAVLTTGKILLKDNNTEPIHKLFTDNSTTFYKPANAINVVNEENLFTDMPITSKTTNDISTTNYNFEKLHTAETIHEDEYNIETFSKATTETSLETIVVTSKYVDNSMKIYESTKLTDMIWVDSSLEKYVHYSTPHIESSDSLKTVYESTTKEYDEIQRKDTTVFLKSSTNAAKKTISDRFISTEFENIDYTTETIKGENVETNSIGTTVDLTANMAFQPHQLYNSTKIYNTIHKINAREENVDFRENIPNTTPNVITEKKEINTKSHTSTMSDRILETTSDYISTDIFLLNNTTSIKISTLKDNNDLKLLKSKKMSTETVFSIDKINLDHDTLRVLININDKTSNNSNIATGNSANKYFANNIPPNNSSKNDDTTTIFDSLERNKYKKSVVLNNSSSPIISDNIFRQILSETDLISNETITFEPFLTKNNENINMKNTFKIKARFSHENNSLVLNTTTIPNSKIKIISTVPNKFVENSLHITNLTTSQMGSTKPDFIAIITDLPSTENIKKYIPNSELLHTSNTTYSGIKIVTSDTENNLNKITTMANKNAETKNNTSVYIYDYIDNPLKEQPLQYTQPIEYATVSSSTSPSEDTNMLNSIINTTKIVKNIHGKYGEKQTQNLSPALKNTFSDIESKQYVIEETFPTKNVQYSTENVHYTNVETKNNASEYIYGYIDNPLKAQTLKYTQPIKYATVSSSTSLTEDTNMLNSITNTTDQVKDIHDKYKEKETQNLSSALKNTFSDLDPKQYVAEATFSINNVQSSTENVHSINSQVSAVESIVTGTNTKTKTVNHISLPKIISKETGPHSKITTTPVLVLLTSKKININSNVLKTLQESNAVPTDYPIKGTPSIISFNSFIPKTDKFAIVSTEAPRSNKNISEFECVTEGRFSDTIHGNNYYICARNNDTFIRLKFSCQNGYHVNKSTVKCELNEANSTIETVYRKNITDTQTSHGTAAIQEYNISEGNVLLPKLVVGMKELLTVEISTEINKESEDEDDTEADDTEEKSSISSNKNVQSKTAQMEPLPAHLPNQQEISNVEIFANNRNTEIKHDMSIIVNTEAIQSSTISKTSKEMPIKSVGNLHEPKLVGSKLNITTIAKSPRIPSLSTTNKYITRTTTTVKPSVNCKSSSGSASTIRNQVTTMKVETTTSNTQKDTNFVCRSKKNGKYAENTDCRKFYICAGKDYPIVSECPIGTVFSDLRKQCTKNLSHCIRNNEFQCPSEGRFHDIFVTIYYYICVKDINHHFIRFKLRCQNGYHVNEFTLKCELNKDNSEKPSVSQSSGESSEKSELEIKSEQKRSTERHRSESKENNIFKCEEKGKFPDPDNCRNYYVCSKKHKRFRQKRKRCKKNEVFHKDRYRCVSADSHKCDYD
ncbi:mucin-3B-like [Plodia interpunctella]|uniref:mucin-3B-like n=1 Tax=Plodia interpunctella TaxID=58824 RepID=UPI002367CC0C|nr:uncharacterized protein LOC128669391 [Plodia interpunctella]